MEGTGHPHPLGILGVGHRGRRGRAPDHQAVSCPHAWGPRSPGLCLRRNGCHLGFSAALPFQTGCSMAAAPRVLPREDLTGSFGQSTTMSRNPPEGSAGMGGPEAPHHYLWAARDREGSFWEASAWDGPARVSGHRPPISHTGGALLGVMLGTWGLRALPRPSPEHQCPPDAIRGSSHSKCSFGATNHPSQALAFSSLALLVSLSFPAYKWGWRARPLSCARAGGRKRAGGRWQVLLTLGAGQTLPLCPRGWAPAPSAAAGNPSGHRDLSVGQAAGGRRGRGAAMPSMTGLLEGQLVSGVLLLDPAHRPWAPGQELRNKNAFV
ncbi:uncharacterized protein LOC131812481 [Mustela lutreola]|uniref:uncharacterized protein LOC131812481 n=1 Tax=Mustela lutreola TaxID=9666 RepID=UPI0027970BD7|nr:uncharacterized protein LOC131812481 [Mustela lutreola]XP_058998061.1 uncharacterized protein LOC131812481 [Mustela lutreola]